MKDIYLTDKQYLMLVQKMLSTIEQPGFKPKYEDSDTVGNKYTISNCGLCNDEWCTEEIAMFPEDFKTRGRKDIKYRHEYHHCPFDNRDKVKWNTSECRSGCFYTCKLFNRKYKTTNDMAKDIIETLNWIKENI